MADVKLIGMDDAAASSNTGANIFMLVRFVAIAGTLKSLRLKSAGSGHAMMAIYADSGDEPGNLLANTGSCAVVTGWNTLPLSDVVLTVGVNYWLAFNSDGNLVLVNPTSGGYRARWKLSQTYSTFSFPNPAGSGFNSNNNFTSRMLAGWGSTGGVGLIGDGLVISEGNFGLVLA